MSFDMKWLNKLVVLSNCGAEEDSWESSLKRGRRTQGHQTSQSWRKSTLNIHWKDRCWSFNTLATWCKEPTHWKRHWCWERLRTGGERDDTGWDGWTASLTQWHEFEPTLGDSEGQGSLACYSPWGHKEFYKTELINNRASILWNTTQQ